MAEREGVQAPMAVGWGGEATEDAHEAWCATSNQVGPQQHHGPRCWAARAEPKAAFFPNFSRAISSPLPCTHPGSTHSAQSHSSPGFVRVLATTTAALGPSWLETTRGPGECGEAPGLQVAWVGHDLEYGRRREHKSRLTVPMPAPRQGCRDPRSSPPPPPPCPMAHTTSQPQG